MIELILFLHIIYLKSLLYHIFSRGGGGGNNSPLQKRMYFDGTMIRCYILALRMLHRYKNAWENKILFKCSGFPPVAVISRFLSYGDLTYLFHDLFHRFNADSRM